MTEKPRNLWSLLPPRIQNELLSFADSQNTDTIYIWHRSYYEQRNASILRRYRQLRTSTNKTKKEIYEQIATEISSRWGEVSVKAVEHVVYAFLV